MAFCYRSEAVFICSSVSDPLSFNSDPDPTYNLNMDPDPESGSRTPDPDLVKFMVIIVFNFL
jgi:hypothetical protein